jgi:hypothetical protein
MHPVRSGQRVVLTLAEDQSHAGPGIGMDEPAWDDDVVPSGEDAYKVSETPASTGRSRSLSSTFACWSSPAQPMTRPPKPKRER